MSDATYSADKHNGRLLNTLGWHKLMENLEFLQDNTLYSTQFDGNLT